MSVIANLLNYTDYVGCGWEIIFTTSIGERMSTGECNLIPAEPLIFPVFEHDPTTRTVNGWHGIIEDPMPDKDGKLFSYMTNATGSWDFYYVPDGEVHSPWDKCGTIWGIDIKDEYDDSTGEIYKSLYNLCYEVTENYPDRAPHSWTMMNDLHNLMQLIQGRRVEAELEILDRSIYYSGRFWISKISTDNSGLTTVTISYDVLPTYTDYTADT